MGEDIPNVNLEISLLTPLEANEIFQLREKCISLVNATDLQDMPIDIHRAPEKIRYFLNDFLFRILCGCSPTNALNDTLNLLGPAPTVATRKASRLWTKETETIDYRFNNLTFSVDKRMQTAVFDLNGRHIVLKDISRHSLLKIAAGFLSDNILTMVKSGKILFEGINFKKGDKIGDLSIFKSVTFRNCLFRHSIDFPNTASIHISKCQFRGVMQIADAPAVTIGQSEFGKGMKIIADRISIRRSSVKSGRSLIHANSFTLIKCNINGINVNTRGQCISLRIVGNIFRGLSDFSSIKCVEKVGFQNNFFSKGFSFDNSNLSGGVDMSAIGFDKNSLAPTFFGANIHDSSTWGNLRNWPFPKRGTSQNARQMVRSYEYLRHEMNKKHRQWEEREFYRLEMLCRLRGDALAKRIPNLFFWILSDYGLSVWRPAFYLTGLLIVFWCLFFKLMEKNFISSVTDGFKLSASSILGPFGMRREIFKRDELAELDGVIHFFMGLESILGVILIFLIGLALRNQFRMRL